MTREEQIVEGAKARGEETGFCELVKSPVSRGVDSAVGIGFIEGAVWADKHPSEEIQRLKTMFESDPDAYEQGYKDAIERFCEFMQSCIGYVVSGEKCNYDTFMKFMEGQQ